VRIVIGEDLFLLRQGLVRLLTAHGFEIAAAVGSAPELLEALTKERPDVGIVDVRLPPTHTDDGLRAAIAARQQVPVCRSWSCLSTWSSCTPASCRPTRPAGSATC
jgi:DNA-binding NarL/FixJ family response regulator